MNYINNKLQFSGPSTTAHSAKEGRLKLSVDEEKRKRLKKRITKYIKGR